MQSGPGKRKHSRQRVRGASLAGAPGPCGVAALGRLVPHLLDDRARGGHVSTQLINHLCHIQHHRWLGAAAAAAAGG